MAGRPDTGDTSWRSRTALLAAGALLLLGGLGSTDLWAPDEPRYAQVSEELRSFEHGAAGLVLLHLNGEVYTQKPPLYFWLVALLGQREGRVGEVDARLPSALAGIACVALTLALGRRLFGAPLGARAGVWGAAVLLCLPRFVHQARRAQLDVLLTLLEGVVLWCFWSLWSPTAAGSAPGRSRLRLAALHGASALAVLTKGPVGLLPWLVIVVFLAWERRLGELRRFFPAWGIALALAPALLWLAAATALAPAGYFADAVVDNVLARFVSGTAHVRPFYYYGYQFPLDFLPGTPLLLFALPLAWRGARAAPQPAEASRARASWRLLLVWLASMLLFFTLSSGKRGLYLLPAFPAAALLCGAALARWLEQPRCTRWLELGTVGLLATVAGGGLLLALRPALLPPAAGLVLPATFAPLLLACAGAGLALVGTGRRLAWPPTHRIAIAIAAWLAIELVAFTLLFPALDPEKSPRPIALAAAAITAPDEPIAVYRQRALAGGIEFYSRRRAVAIESESALLRFVADGGRAIVAKQRHVPALDPLLRTSVRAQARHGRRRIVLLQAQPSDTAGAPP